MTLVGILNHDEIRPADPVTSLELGYQSHILDQRDAFFDISNRCAIECSSRDPCSLAAITYCHDTVMVVKIRLARFGRRHAPFYNIVVAQARYTSLLLNHTIH